MRRVLGLLLISRLAIAGADSTFEAGKTAFGARDFVTAAAQLEVFVHTFPNDARIGEAGVMWVDAISAIEPNDQPRMVRAIEELYALPITGVNRERIVRLHDRVLEQQIRELLKARDPRAAATLGEQRISLAVTKRATFDRIYETFGSYQSAHDIAGARRKLQQGIELDPAYHLVQAMRLQLGDLEQATDPEDAAENYLAGAAWCHDCADYSEFRLTAADLFIALGRPKRAYDEAASYLADFPTNVESGERAALLLTTAAAQISDELAETADRAYLRRAHPKRAAEIWLHLGLVTQKLGKRAASEAALSKAIKLTELAPNMHPLYGQALFARAELVAADAEQVSLAVPSTKITSALQERTRRVEAALAAYEDVAASKDLQWTIAAIDHAAHAYEEYATALERAEPLASENDAERMAYRQAIASFAVKNVVDGYRTAYEMANANNYHGEYAIDAFRQLQRLDPKTYPATPHDPLRNGDPIEPPLEQDARLDAGR